MTSAAPAKETRRLDYIWKLRGYYRQVAGQLTIGSIAGIFAAIAAVLPAIYLGKALDTAIRYGRGEVPPGAVIQATLWYFGSALTAELPRIVKQWFLVSARWRTVANIRGDALRGFLGWPMERIQRTSVGDLVARTNGDVDVLVQVFTQIYEDTWDEVLAEVAVGVAMFFISADLTLWALLPIPPALVLAHACGRWIDRRTAATRESNSRLTAAIQEYIVGVRVLRVFGGTGRAINRIAALSRDQAEKNISLARLRTGLLPAYGVLMTAGVVFVVWFGTNHVLAGAMTVGSLVAFLQLYARFVMRAPRVPSWLNGLQGGAAAYRRIEPMLAPPSPLKEEPPWSSFRWTRVNGTGVAPKTAAAGVTGPARVDIQGVTFGFPGSTRPALQNVSMTAKPGSLVAITGPVGSGKSALAKVLVGLYPVREGRVLLDGRSLNDISDAEHGTRVGYLPQDARIFSGTIKENVLFNFGGLAAPPGAAATLAEAVGTASLSRDLEMLPKGLDTSVGEGGVRVSGGQRQRIALARAIAASAPVTPGLLVLDDPFSAVDAETEAAIIAGLREAFGATAPPDARATIFLFSHRLSMFPQADFIAVLDEGRVVQQGTHDQLMSQPGLYRTIFEAQSRLLDSANRNVPEVVYE